MDTLPVESRVSLVYDNPFAFLSDPHCYEWIFRVDKLTSENSFDELNGEPETIIVENELEFCDNFGIHIDENSKTEISIPSLLDFGRCNFSISLWIKTSQSTCTILAPKNRQGQDSPLILRLFKGRIVFEILHFENYFYCGLETADSFNDNEWHNIIVTRKGRAHTMYVDGLWESSYGAESGSISGRNYVIGHK